MTKKPLKSLETLNRHNQTHNDIKPQNFLVKFQNGPNDLTQIEIVLTDFGMAGSDSKGGTPIFASPECFEKKEKKSDIFSFGRVILFLLLTKNQFVKWLYVPVKDLNQILSARMHTSVPSNVDSKQCLHLVSKMTSLTNRIDLNDARIQFDSIRRNLKVKLEVALLNTLDSTINAQIQVSSFDENYADELCDFR